MTKPVSSTKADWLVPAGLIALSAVPVIAGAARLLEFSGATVTEENARYFAARAPLVLHIASVTVFSLLGALQFSDGLRRRMPAWHRGAGRALVASGLLAALSGLWLTQVFSPGPFDGPALYVIRLVVGVSMALSILLGLDAIRRRDFGRHQAWMMRGYALGLGAGTQVLTHVPLLLWPDLQGELARTLCMAAGWVINIAVAEWILARRSGAGRPRAARQPAVTTSAA